MTVDLVWMEGLPPELETRALDAIASLEATARLVLDYPDCIEAKTARHAARIEGENVHALLQEWRVNEEATA